MVGIVLILWKRVITEGRESILVVNSIACVTQRRFRKRSVQTAEQWLMLAILRRKLPAVARQR